MNERAWDDIVYDHATFVVVKRTIFASESCCALPQGCGRREGFWKKRWGRGGMTLRRVRRRRVVSIAFPDFKISDLERNVFKIKKLIKS